MAKRIIAVVCFALLMLSLLSCKDDQDNGGGATDMTNQATENKIATVGTISYMPAIFGCFCASHVIRSILSQ